MGPKLHDNPTKTVFFNEYLTAGLKVEQTVVRAAADVNI